MLKEMLTMALRGLVDQLAINPRNLRLQVLLDDEEHTLARVDAKTVGALLNEPAERRVLRFKAGNLAFDIPLGARGRARTKKVTRVRQRGYRDE